MSDATNLLRRVLQSVEEAGDYQTPISLPAVELAQIAVVQMDSDNTIEDLLTKNEQLRDNLTKVVADAELQRMGREQSEHEVLRVENLLKANGRKLATYRDALEFYMKDGHNADVARNALR